MIISVTSASLLDIRGWPGTVKYAAVVVLRHRSCQEESSCQACVSTLSESYPAVRNTTFQIFPGRGVTWVSAILWVSAFCTLASARVARVSLWCLHIILLFLY